MLVESHEGRAALQEDLSRKKLSLGDLGTGETELQDVAGVFGQPVWVDVWDCWRFVDDSSLTSRGHKHLQLGSWVISIRHSCCVALAQDLTKGVRLLVVVCIGLVLLRVNQVHDFLA